MIAALSRPVRRGLALGLLAALLLAGEMLVLAPLRDWHATAEAERAQAALLLARTQAALARARDEAGAPAPPAPDALLLQASDDTLAASLLQGMLRAAADAEAISLATIQVEPPAALPGARSIALTVSLNARFAPLLALLHRLESGPLLVRVQALDVQATEAEADPMLSATLTLAALLREPAA